MTTQLEDLLWTRGVDGEDGWKPVIDQLVARLGETLGQEMVVDQITLLERDAFSCLVRAPVAVAGPLRIELRGVLGMEPIEAASHVSATLIPFSMGKRVTPVGQTPGTVEFVFEKRSDGSGAWTCQGWVSDVYGEWDGFGEEEE